MATTQRRKSDRLAKKHRHAHTILHRNNGEAILATPIDYDEEECEVGCDNEFDAMCERVCEKVARWEVEVPVVYYKTSICNGDGTWVGVGEKRLDWHEKNLCDSCKDRLFAFHRK